MPDDAKPSDARVLQVLGVGKDGGRHSPLFVWMQEHHAALKAEFETRGPQWAERTRAMAEAGLVDGDGDPPTQRTAMQTWYRVCRAERLKGPPTPAMAGTLPPPAVAKLPPKPAPTPPAASTPEADASAPDFDFKFAGGLKDWSSKPERS